MIKRFQDTGRKSGMIFVSSVLGEMPVAGAITYSAAKGFMSFLSQGLSVEFEGKIDCLNYHLGITNTKFLDDMKGDPHMKDAMW